MTRRRIEDVSYDEFRQRVRRHRRTDVLLAAAQLNVELEREALGLRPALLLSNVVQPFALAGVARTALIAGNDHRNLPVTLDDLVQMCAYYANVESPVLDLENEPGWVRHLVGPIAYEQFESQYSPIDNIARALCLLNDHAPSAPEAPTSAEWDAALGAPLDLCMQIGFTLHVAALQNGGCISLETLQHSVAPTFESLERADVLALIDRWFAAPPDELSSIGRTMEIAGLEKWSFNPLVAKPIVMLKDGRLAAPWPRLVLDRISPTGLYHVGLGLFGPSFPNCLGPIFESYVGAQLRQLPIDIRDEIVYGKNAARTVDYFLITPEVVVLIEVKAARPVESTRVGHPDGDDDMTKKIGAAFDQIDRTAQMIRDRHPALSGIPDGTPVRGLVVTLEPFHLVNTVFFDDLLPEPSIPTTVAPARELESVVAGLRTVADIGSRLLRALTPEDGRTVLLGDAVSDLANHPNPLLDDALGRLGFANVAK